MSNSHVQSAKAIAEDIAHLCCVPDDWRLQISDLAVCRSRLFVAKPSSAKRRAPLIAPEPCLKSRNFLPIFQTCQLRSCLDLLVPSISTGPLKGIQSWRFSVHGSLARRLWRVRLQVRAPIFSTSKVPPTGKRLLWLRNRR